MMIFGAGLVGCLFAGRASSSQNPEPERAAVKGPDAVPTPQVVESGPTGGSLMAPISIDALAEDEMYGGA